MKHVLLLHGAIGSKDQLDKVKDGLSKEFEVSSINFRGHGGEPGSGAFSIQQFAKEVLDWMKAKSLDKTSVFGYSMGGYVALYLARHYPQAVEAVITLGTKLHWDETTAAKEVGMLNPEVIEQKFPTFAGQLAQRHHPADWKEILHKTAAMLKQMGSSNPLPLDEYKNIAAKILILLGDRDKMVSFEEAVAVYRQLPSAQLGILPNTPHAIEGVEVEPLVTIVKKFLQ